MSEPITLYLKVADNDFIKVTQLVLVCNDGREKLLIDAKAQDSPMTNRLTSLPSNAVAIELTTELGRGAFGAVSAIRRISDNLTQRQKQALLALVDEFLDASVLKKGSGNFGHGLVLANEKAYFERYYQTKVGLRIYHTSATQKEVLMLMKRVPGLSLGQLMKNFISVHYAWLAHFLAVKPDKLSPAIYLGAGSYLANLHESWLWIQVGVLHLLEDLKERRIVHGDFKPDNIMVPESVLKLFISLDKHFLIDRKKERCLLDQRSACQAMLPIDFGYAREPGESVQTVRGSGGGYLALRQSRSVDAEEIPKAAYWHDAHSYFAFIQMFSAQHRFSPVFVDEGEITAKKLTATHFLRLFMQQLQAREFDAVYYLACHPALIIQLKEQSSLEHRKLLLNKHFIFPELLTELLTRNPSAFQQLLKTSAALAKAFKSLFSNSGLREGLLALNVEQLQTRLEDESLFGADLSSAATHVKDICCRLDTAELHLSVYLENALKSQLLAAVLANKNARLTLPFVTMKEIPLLLQKLAVTVNYSMELTARQLKLITTKTKFSVATIGRIVARISPQIMQEFIENGVADCFRESELGAFLKRGKQSWLKTISLADLMLLQTKLPKARKFQQQFHALLNALNYSRFREETRQFALLNPGEFVESLKTKYNIRGELLASFVEKLYLDSCVDYFEYLQKKYFLALSWLTDDFARGYNQLMIDEPDDKLEQLRELVANSSLKLLVIATCKKLGEQDREMLQQYMECLSTVLKSSLSVNSILNAVIAVEKVSPDNIRQSAFMQTLQYLIKDDPPLMHCFPSLLKTKKRPGQSHSSLWGKVPITSSKQFPKATMALASNC